MKIALVLVACLAFVAADFVSRKTEVKFADKDFLLKQKFILEILHHVYQPLQYEEYIRDGEHYVEGETNYKVYEPVVEFFKMYKHGMLPQGHIYSVFNEVHLKETVHLFNFFYNCKDWTTFYKNVVWARMHMNEGMFVYALTVAVAHMEDLAGIVLPAPYEISPFVFYNGEVMSEAASWMMQGMYKKMDKFHIVANYTSDYYMMNEESKLAYFTEDIGLNSYYYNFHVDYPFWMEGKKYDIYNERRGEQYLYTYQQLLARYYLERLSNGMGVIPEFSWMTPIKTGYNPMMRYHNGIGFTYRKNYYEVYTTEDYQMLNMIEDYERRIRDVIDSGFVTLRDGTKFDMRKPESIHHLGNMIQGNPDSVDNKFFGYLTFFARQLLSGADYEYVTDYKIIPSVMEHFETAMRDPVFYQLYKRIVKYYFQFKNYLPSYKYEELMLQGIKIKNVNIGKLVTYFDYFDADITTSVDFNRYPMEINSMQNEDTYKMNKYHKHDFMILAKQYRLNHKPFSVNIDVVSDKAEKVVFRVYMGPKYDQYGNLYRVNDNRENFVEIDQFVYELPVGAHTIVRESKDFYYSVKDRTTYSELYKFVMRSLEGNMQFPLDMSEAHCGFPDRLLLPKGRSDGMPMQFFVMMTPFVEGAVTNKYDHSLSCLHATKFYDNLPFGYPFDRIINEAYFYTPNMFFKDVFIYHKNPEMMSNYVVA